MLVPGQRDGPEEDPLPREANKELTEDGGGAHRRASYKGKWLLSLLSLLVAPVLSATKSMMRMMENIHTEAQMAKRILALMSDA